MGHNLKTSTKTKDKFIQESQIINDYKKNKKSFANSKKIDKFAVMIVTNGLHDSFSRIKKLAFAIRHARWNVGNFKRCIEYESIANVHDIVDVTCRILSISYGCNADRFRPRFVSVGA